MNWDNSQPVMSPSGLSMLRQRRRNRAGLIVNRIAVTLGLILLAFLLLFTPVMMATGHMHPEYHAFTEHGTTYRVFTVLFN